MANIITELHLEMSANWYVSKKLNSIGRVGENTVTKLIIEPTEIINNVTYEIEIMGADGSKNVAELTVDGTKLYLILTANMLSVSGITKMQVRGLFEDGSIKKSNIFELKVNRSISATEAYEEYAVTIFDQLVQDCRDIIEGAESYAIRAETAAVNAEAYSESASASAQAASASEATASTASTAAVNAATSAESASTSAHTSAETATTAANSASTSASNASTSATNAANNATSAATSATNAHNSEVNASTSEINASTSATEAAASAESIAASVAQISENTYRINDLEAIIGGYQLTDLPTGAIATVTDGTALLMPSLKIGIEPVQDLHGYDHPWAGGAGKNLFDLSTMINGLYSDENFTVIQDTSTVYRSYKYYLKAGTYTFSASKKVRILRSVIDGVYSSSQSDLPYTFSITSDGYVGFSFRNKDDTDWNINTNCQIELGNQVTSYEPYSNICPISGWTAANIIVSPTTSAEDGTTYNVQFRDGDNPLTVYGGTLDVTTGELVVTKGYVFFDGSNDEEWILFNNPDFNVNQLYVNISNVVSSTGISEGNTLCDKFKSISIDNRNGNFNTCYAGRNGICFNIKDFTVEMWKNWLTDNNVAVAYTLETPITYHLTPTQVRTLVGNNNIWADTGDIIEGKYFKEL